MSRLLTILLFVCLGVLHSHAQTRLNVLLITADDLGIQVGCYGDKAARTPHMDQLAKRGVLFENAYVAQASCSPSRSAMFTGLYPHANGQYGLTNADVGFELHESVRPNTIPNLLKKAGYSTAILGKLHVAPENSFQFDQRLRGDTRDVKTAVHSVGGFIRECDQPFFVMANFSDPHVLGRSPRPPKEAFPTQYKGVPEHPLKVGEVPPFPFQKIETEEQIARVTQYYNAVSRFDEAVGLLIAELEQAGVADSTLILLAGDHGPPFFRSKTTCYEAGVKVPLLAVWPGVFSAGERNPALVSTVDLLPTILDAAGLPLPQPLHGRSLRHVLEKTQHRGYLATEFHYHGSAPFFPRRSLRDARFKLIHNLRAKVATPVGAVDGDQSLSMSREAAYAGGPVGDAFNRAAQPPEYELYDLENDPWEFKNLAESAEHLETLEKLKSELLAWRNETADPLLTEEGMTRMLAYEKPMKRRPADAGKNKNKAKNKQPQAGTGTPTQTANSKIK